MAKLLDFETPTGQKGNVLNPMSWVPLVLGTVVLLATFSMGEKLGSIVSGKIPLVNTRPQYPFAPTAQAAPASTDLYIG